MLRQPSEKRKMAETSANLSTWCESTEAPILDAGHHVELMRGEEEEGDVQALDDAERAEPEVVAEDGEVAVEERHRPADLGKDEHDDLEDDEQPAQDRPEHARGLVRDCATPEAEVSNDEYAEPRRETYST